MLINIMYQIYASLKVGLPSSQSPTTLHHSSDHPFWRQWWAFEHELPADLPERSNEDIFPSSVRVSLMIVWEDENIINNTMLESEWVAVATATQASH